MARDKNGRDGNPKKKRKRKMRVNEMSSDESGDERAVPQVASAEAVDVPVEVEDEVMVDATPGKTEELEAQPDFAAWYLKEVAQELEEDLDKIRSASDFKQSSLPVLINALQQGESLFSKEEKSRILGAT